MCTQISPLKVRFFARGQRIVGGSIAEAYNFIDQPVYIQIHSQTWQVRFGDICPTILHSAHKETVQLNTMGDMFLPPQSTVRIPQPACQGNTP